MVTVESFDPQQQNLLNATNNAVQKVKELIAEEGKDNLKFRVFISGGGCSGFQYGFSFDAKMADDDTIIEQDGIKIIIDALSLPYLRGAVVEYEEGLTGSRFLVTNPNAKNTCSCGLSFAI